MAQPDLIITPFADSAVPGTIDPIPENQDPALPQRASWLLGFPGVTMTPLAAGGIPPRGQDFNGVLNALSQHIVWLGRGGQYVWDSAIAAADGYPLGALLQKVGIDGFWLNTVEGNISDPDAGGAGWVDANSATLPYANDTGAANAYVATYAPAISALTTGQVVRFKASNANTGASTFNPNGLGAKPIVSISGAAIAAGAIAANGHVWLQYDAAIGGGSWVSLLSATSVDTMNSAIATVAAAATINLTTGAPSTSQIAISGSGVSINGFTVAANRFFVVKMSGANTLVNSATLVTQTGGDIVTAAGDSFLARATASNTVEILCYVRANSSKSRCTAWVNFNGTGTPAIRDSFNVSSITDNGTGDYTAVFSSNMDNTNYNHHATFTEGTATAYAPTVLRANVLVGSIRVSQVGSNNGSPVSTDWANCNITIHGGKA